MRSPTRGTEKVREMEDLKPSGLSNAAIAKYAERVAAHYGIFNQSGKADLDILLEELGGEWIVADSLESGERLEIQRPGDFRIIIPQFTSERRDRFTIAHEVGHYFLHYLYPAALDEQTEPLGERVFARGGQNRAETEANVFASSLLMPEREFREAFNEVGANWWALGDVFDVSPRAAEVRASVLGLS